MSRNIDTLTNFRRYGGRFVPLTQFGTWNGTATSAQLVDQFGNPVNSAQPSAIYRTDWQGTTSWARYPSTFAWNDTGYLNITLYLHAGVTVYAAFGQIEASAVPGSFIQGSVGSFPTLTDYTLSGATVNLAQAPVSTATTEWQGRAT